MNIQVFIMNRGKETGPPAGYFDTTTQTYYPKHPPNSIGGFGSNCTVCLWGISRLLNRGYLPRHISFKNTMEWFKEGNQEDIYSDIFQTNNSLISNIDLNYRYPEKRLYDPVDIHGNYCRIDYKHITPLVRAYFSPSELVLAEVRRLIHMLNLEPQNLISVFYRGTDHWKEGSIVDPEKYLRLTKKLLSQNNRYKVLIQTDQKQVRDLFLLNFKKRCVSIAELPTTDRTDADSLINWLDVIPNKRHWNVVYMAAMLLISQSKIILNHTGNSACWVNLFRGSPKEVYQFSNKGNLYKTSWNFFNFLKNIN